MLRLSSLTLLCVLSCLVFAQDKDEAARKELVRLQGEWKLISGEAGGQAMPANVVNAFSMVVKDNQYEFRNSLETEKGTLVLNVTPKPAQIDIVITDGSYKGQKQIGIYEINDKKVKFCITQPGETKRPEKFVSTAENQCMIFEFEQVKK
jgi:uncharacterized protein (TIGR03067 family)